MTAFESTDVVVRRSGEASARPCPTVCAPISLLHLFDASVGRARAALSGRDELGWRGSRRRWPRLTSLRDRRARRCCSTSCGALATTRGARRQPAPRRMGLAVLSIIQGERFQCADGARLHHLGEYDSEPLLKHHAALAQLIAGHAVYRAGAGERRHWSSCSSSGRARMRKR